MPGTFYPNVAAALQAEYKGGHALEVGAGAGVYRNLFETYTGIDLYSSPYKDPGSIDVFADARSLPFHDNVFDFSFAVSVMHLIPEPEKAFQEIARVLKPGSSLLWFDLPQRIKKRNLGNAAARGEKTIMSLWAKKDLRDIADRAGFSLFHICRWTKFDILAGHIWPDYEPLREPWIIYRFEK